MKTYVWYKNQIQGFEDMSETVKTMEKIAASSVHFLKVRLANLDEYQRHLENTLARLSVFYGENDHQFLSFENESAGAGAGNQARKQTQSSAQSQITNKAKNKALIIITGDKGLVGGLWHRIINSFLSHADDYQSIIVLGSKGGEYLKEEGVKIIKSFGDFTDIPSPEEVYLITNYVFDAFKKEKFSKADVLFPRFISLTQQEPALISFIPFKLKIKREESQNVSKSNEVSKDSSGLPIFEPKKQKLFDQLLKKYISVYLHKIVLETKLSEFSARTVAMEHANAKTKQFIQKLNLSFRKNRRRTVTQRQLESFVAHKI